MTTDPIHSTNDFDRLIGDFERAWQRMGEAEPAAFLPSRDHPAFQRIATELLCIDMEMRWSRGSPRSLEQYRHAYPDALGNTAVLREVAFEEYRQRIIAGVSGKEQEYRNRYGVETENWPRSAKTITPVAEGRTEIVELNPGVDGLPRTTEIRAAFAEALRQSSPGSAERFDEAIAALPAPGDRIFGFELVEKLGEGAFASVFRARQSELAERPVVLKVAPNLSDEPRKLARLQHTNIVPIYSTHQNVRLHAVCMPYLGSLTLDHLLKSLSDRPNSFPKSGRELLSTLFDRHSTTVEDKKQAAPVAAIAANESAAATPILDMMARFSHIEAVLWMGARLADGLAHAHERGILHLDLKPANILLTDEGQPMLLDFNLAIDLNEVESLEFVRLGGTLPYMSPEQLTAFSGGKRDLDARSDLYSLGIILYEMLTGRSPFPKRLGKLPSMVRQLLSDRQEPIVSPRHYNSAIPAAVSSIIEKLLEPDRSRRYRNAAELREDFERQLANLPLKHAPDRSLPERARKWQRRHPRSSVAVLVSLAAILFLLLPATVLAIREDQIARRKLQVEAVEARQHWQESSQQARTIQVLLATRTGERSTLEQELKHGKKILESYGIAGNPDWMKKPLFARLPAAEQEQARLELGEMLLFMARAAFIRAMDCQEPARREEGLRESLRFNELAFQSYPPGEIPRMLFEQRSALARSLPEGNIQLSIAERSEDKPAEYDAYHTGVDCAMTGRYREALAVLQPFTEDHPRHFQSWYVRGICHDNLEELSEAIAAWTACIAMHPEMPDAYFNRGLIWLRQANHERAARDFTKALQLKPVWTDALIDRAIARKELKDYVNAIGDLDEVIKQPDSPVRARFLRAEVEKLNGQAAEAARELAEALKIQPKDELGWSTRGYERMATEPKEALADLNAALALNPRSRDALINKSILLSEFLDRPREAVAVLGRFLEYYPDHIAARLGRGVILARLGECQLARRDAEECLKRERSAYFLFQSAGLYAQISRHETGREARLEALAALSSALKKGFDDLELLKADSDLNPIREEPEFKKLLEIAAGLKKSSVK